jgi:type I pantothenate kinase
VGGSPEGTDLAAPVVEILRRRVAADGGRPLLVGIAGSVAVGKSTLAAAIVHGLPFAVHVLGTDGFLYPNHELAARGLGLRKGFPDSYDDDRIRETLGAIREGRSARVPVYSHETYDIVPGASRGVDPAPVFVLEGVNALQFAADLDCGVYLDAPVDAIEDWYVARLRQVTADPPPGSFYAAWVGLDDAEFDALARDIWRTINLVNLREHIEPTRSRADVVVVKDAQHALVAVDLCG